MSDCNIANIANMIVNRKIVDVSIEPSNFQVINFEIF